MVNRTPVTLFATAVVVAGVRTAFAWTSQPTSCCHRNFRAIQLKADLDNNNDDTSVGDYVQGVHGGKYQFEQAGGATFAGRQFAESLYASDPNEGVIYDNNDDGNVPAWAERMGTSAKLGILTPLQRYPILSVALEEATAITIANEERSWEHYYSKVVQVASDGTVLDDTAVWCHESSQQQPTDCIVTVSPATGHLAPRGGSSNLCDPSKPYSDSSQIQITRASDGAVTSGDHYYLLVVGTEAETRPHWIQLV
ncbi:expressed unknown protein [Seminavis robusta]|uniref:Uncharacterized protein n=1 Tax=Seminavis robusta TaxID=568900 RepID=A0A9N8HE32_9STRA|nr:expressed unknown protein [Seminavis robusta]|eukprot:Sro387_g132200.1 n/a (253) ;mRNA; f:63497-64255